MKRILLLTVSIFIALSGVAYGAAKWNGFDVKKIYFGGKEVTNANPAIVVKGQTFVPVSMLRQMGLTVKSDSGGINVEQPPQKPVEAARNTLTPFMLELLSQYVYKVLGSTSDPTIANQGSGFIVNGIFVTNYHVAGESSFAQVEIDGKTQRITKFEFANKDTDLMGFKVDGGKSLPISIELPKVGDTVYAIGFPNEKLAITEGLVHFISVDEGKRQIVHSAQIENGSSGGVLLNGKGEIIGVNRSGGGVVNGKTFSWAIPTMYLNEELKK